MSSNAEKTQSEKSAKKSGSRKRSALASICSYSTPSPEGAVQQDALENVSNDSLLSYSPPRRESRDSKNLSPEQIEPYPVSREELPSGGNAKKEVREKAHKKKSKEKDRYKEKKKRAKSPVGSHEKKRKKHRHRSVDSPPPPPEVTVATGGKGGSKTSKKSDKHVKKHQSKDVSPRSSKVVPKVYQTGSEDEKHSKYVPTFDDISPISSPESHKRPSRYSESLSSSRRRSPSPPSRHVYSPLRSRHARSPSPYYQKSRKSSPYRRYDSSLSPPCGRRRTSRSPQRRGRYSKSPPPRRYSSRSPQPSSSRRYLSRSPPVPSRRKSITPPRKRYLSRSPHRRYSSRSPEPSRRYGSRSPIGRRLSKSPARGRRDYSRSPNSRSGGRYTSRESIDSPQHSRYQRHVVVGSPVERVGTKTTPHLSGF